MLQRYDFYLKQPDNYKNRKSYPRRGFLQEYDIRVQFWEAPLQLGYWQVGGDDKESLTFVVLTSVEIGEGQALELESQKLVQQIRPIHTPMGVAT